MNIAELRKKSVKRAKAEPAPEQRSPTLSTPSLAAPESALVPASPPLRETMPTPTPTSEVSPPPQAASLHQRLDELFAESVQLHNDSEALLLAGTWSKETATVEEFRQMLSFSLGSEEYALDIHDIREIIKPREITEIPRVPDFILGIISLRGIVIPVFDLKRRFKLGTSILSPSSRIIVCQRENKSAGLLVDNISQVIKLPCASVEPPPPVLYGVERELLEGVGRYRERMLILLNMSCVLNTDLI